MIVSISSNPQDMLAALAHVGFRGPVVAIKAERVDDDDEVLEAARRGRRMVRRGGRKTFPKRRRKY